MNEHELTDAPSADATPQADATAAETDADAVNVEAWLALNRYEVNEDAAHILLFDDPPPEDFATLVRVCPAALYRFDEEGRQTFDYAGCLECGSCRVAASATVVRDWRYPAATKGVQYRYG
jgi:ferredoxin-like protein FixX